MWLICLRVNIGVHQGPKWLSNAIDIADTGQQGGADSCRGDEDGAAELRRASQGVPARDAFRSGGQQQVRAGERRAEAEGGGRS